MATSFFSAMIASIFSGVCSGHAILSLVHIGLIRTVRTDNVLGYCSLVQLRKYSLPGD